MSDLVERAKDLAHRAHAGQVDKAGRPYIEHVSRVATAVADCPVAEAVAWLHDVLEDSPQFASEVAASFPYQIRRQVELLTRENFPDGAYYPCIRAQPVALRVKMADIADNADESRLALLDDKTAARLRRKYAKARQMLTPVEGGGDG